MVIQNKIFPFKIKRQAKNVFPSDVERTVSLGPFNALAFRFGYFAVFSITAESFIY